MPENSPITQMNANIPSELKSWAKQQAAQDFQSLSGFIAKLIYEERLRRQNHCIDEVVYREENRIQNTAT